VGLERVPLSLVRITEELLKWESSGSGSGKSRLTAVGIRCADLTTHSIPQKFARTSPTRGGRSGGTSRTKAMEFSFSLDVSKRQSNAMNPDFLLHDYREIIF
jgi:hypothetical protein